MGVVNVVFIIYFYMDIISLFNLFLSFYDYIINSFNIMLSSVIDFMLVSGEEDSVLMVEFFFNLVSLIDLDVFVGVDVDYGVEIYVNGV